LAMIGHIYLSRPNGTHDNKLNEHKAHLEVPDHKKSSLDYNHYLEAIEGNFELRTEKKSSFT